MIRMKEHPELVITEKCGKLLVSPARDECPHQTWDIMDADREIEGAAKPATFPADQTTPLVARLIRDLATGDDYVSRQATIDALLADAEGRRIVDETHRSLFYRTEEWIAGSILDQFAKDLERKGSPVYNQFERQQIDNVWAFQPK